MDPRLAVNENMDKFEKVAGLLGWVSQRDRKVEGWNQFVVFNGTHGRRYSVNFHPGHYVVSGMKTAEFEKHGGYLSNDDGRLSDTTSRMSANKSAETLAKEIQRRVISNYEKFWSIMTLSVDQSKEYILKTATQANRVGNILDARVKGVNWNGQEFIQEKGEEVRMTKSFPDSVNLNIRFYGESARWEYVSFPADLHEKLCQVIADHFKREE